MPGVYSAARWGSRSCRDPVAQKSGVRVGSVLSGLQSPEGDIGLDFTARDLQERADPDLLSHGTNGAQTPPPRPAQQPQQQGFRLIAPGMPQGDPGRPRFTACVFKKAVPGDAPGLFGGVFPPAGECPHIGVPPW